MMDSDFKNYAELQAILDQNIDENYRRGMVDGLDVAINQLVSKMVGYRDWNHLLDNILGELENLRRFKLYIENN